MSRIAIVASWYLPVPPKKYGGTEQVVYYLIKGLKELGHEPVLIGAGDSEINCEIVPIVDKHTFFPLTKEDVPAFREMEKGLYQKTYDLVKKIAPTVDIIHSHGFDMKDFQNYPNVTTLHGPNTFEKIAYYEQRKECPYISISNNQREAYPDLDFISTIYNGEDPEKFPVITEPEDYVCFIGRFDREKNPHLAIQLAIRHGVKIKVAGKYDYLGEGYFDEEIKPLLNNPLVEFLGELGFEEKVELLSKAKCNLHPTNFREPFGLTVLEAAYCGTPTLAVSRGSMPELIEEGRTGILVEDFIEGYKELDECFALHRGYIATRARSLFNYKGMAKQYVEAYKKVIERYKK